MNKKSFYCWYLGFTEAYGLQGQTKIHEVIKNFLTNQFTQKDAVQPSKVTVRLSEMNMTLIDSSAPPKRNSRKTRSNSREPKTYMIGYDKITYVGRVANQPDILTCIVRSDTTVDVGVNISKKSLFYLHVFRCDSDESTKKLEIYLNYFRKLYFKKIEKIQLKKQKEAINSKKYLPTSQNEHLINSNLKENFIQRQINKISSGSQHRQHENSNSSAGTHSTSSHNDLSLISPVNSNSSLNFKHHGRPTSPNIKNINDELIGKIKKGEPLLYPPKDYTQTLVKRGNLPDANNRRSRNPLIVGKEGLKMRDQNLMNLELNDSFMSDHFSPRNLSFNGSNTNRSDYNLDEQQVLNLLDEVVDSVSMVPEYRYEPIMEHKQRDEPDLFNSISSDNFIENSLQMIEEENPFISNRLRTEQDFFNKRNLNNIKEVSRKNSKKPTSTETPYRRKLFSFSGSKSDKESNPSVNNSMSAASIGVRTNVLTKLGNFKPKIIIDTHQQPQYYGSKNEELKQNVYSPYKADYASNSGLRRISEETNNLYVSNNNHSNSEFILKPTDHRVYSDENNEKYKNYVQVQKNNLLGTLINVNAISNNNISKKINNNFKNYQNPNQYNQNVINVYELNRRFDYGEAKRYDLNDIYY